jgi:hypothetical protein
MDFELTPTIILRSRSFNVLQAPREMFIKTLNQNINLQRFRILYVSGNYSGILSKLDRKYTDLEVRRTFTAFQLMTILEETRHPLVIVEHDPSLYEDAAEMVEYVSHALSDAAKEAALLLYSPGSDRFLEDLAKNADRVWYFDEGPRASPKLVARSHPKAQKNQATLEAFS